MWHKYQFIQIDPYDWFCAPGSDIIQAVLTKVEKCWKQLSVLNTERTVWILIVLDAGHQRSEVRDRRTEESRTPRETESGPSADELMVDSWTSDWRKAAKGTWDTSVGLAELMSESIFSASLLQASICTGEHITPQTGHYVPCRPLWYL